MSVEIRADYEQLQQVSTRFESQSQAIGQMLQDIRACVQKLADGGWKGRGADAFIVEMQEKVLPTTEALQQSLADSARTTQLIGQVIRQAEEESSTLFPAT